MGSINESLFPPIFHSHLCCSSAWLCHWSFLSTQQEPLINGTAFFSCFSLLRAFPWPERRMGLGRNVTGPSLFWMSPFQQSAARHFRVFTQLLLPLWTFGGSLHWEWQLSHWSVMCYQPWFIPISGFKIYRIKTIPRTAVCAFIWIFL